MPNEEQLRAVAERFAAALDTADWSTAAGLLHPECRYDCRGSILIGPSLLDGYRTIDEWVKSTFDAVRYESRVEVEPSQARIHFRDLIDHGPHHLDFRCQQIIRIDNQNRITEIQHIDLPGEPEKAKAFNQACRAHPPKFVNFGDVARS